MRFPRLSYWGLVAIAVASVLAHVCAAPFHAHAGAIATHEEHDSHHGGEPAGEDAVHAASCDALKAASAELPVVLGPSAILPVPAAPVAGNTVTSDGVAVAAGVSPPLFLLHASLLI